LSGAADTRGDLIFISHRIPWPLNKGEKIRGWNLIQHMSRRYRVHLGCVVDDPADMAHVERLRGVCASVGAFPIDRRRQKLRALLHARPGRPLMPDFYYAPALQAWVDETMARVPMDVVYIYSVAMAPYARLTAAGRRILDAQDIDSEKWAEYALTAPFPMRLVWAREARTLLAYERASAASCALTFFVSEPEAARFRELAPEVAERSVAVENGVDLARFSPADTYPSPFGTSDPCMVFTGNMDYWPNADAVIWFAREIMPKLRARVPAARFWAVGANPGPDVLALAGLPGVHVTGRVEDVRPYVAHAAAIVCPLRIARGIQNKVLEGMAMGRPVIASPAAYEGVHAAAGTDLLVADGADAFVDAICAVLDGAHPGLARAARAAMERHYAWHSVLAGLDAHLARPPPRPSPQGGGS
jgi:sugar transferase (PEP-CTERM/EpsH1 system associated)